MPSYRDEVVVLRTHTLGESDRIVTMLAKGRGKIRAVAKGVRRTSSRIGARLEPFMVADVQCYEGRSLDTVTQVETLAAYGADIATDYPRFTAATAMVEAADKLSDTEHSPQQYVLLVGALRALSRGERIPGVILDSYLLRAFALAGWSPSLEGCARCGREGRQSRIVVQLGGVVCDECAPPGTPSLDPEAISVLSALLRGDWPIVEGASASSMAQASGITAAFVQWHLERSLRALAHVQRAGS